MTQEEWNIELIRAYESMKNLNLGVDWKTYINPNMPTSAQILELIRLRDLKKKLEKL